MLASFGSSQFANRKPSKMHLPPLSLAGISNFLKLNLTKNYSSKWTLKAHAAEHKRNSVPLFEFFSLKPKLITRTNCS